MTSVGVTKKKLTQFNPPSCVFLNFNWYLEPWSVILTLGSVTEKDLIKTCLVKNPLLVLVLLNLVVHLYHMDKSKKSSFNSRKFRKQIKKSLMETWEDLDSESGSEKEEVEDEANVDVGLVATLTSEAEPDSDSEDENGICLRAKEKKIS